MPNFLRYVAVAGVVGGIKPGKKKRSLSITSPLVLASFFRSNQAGEGWVRGIERAKKDIVTLSPCDF